MDMQMMVAGRLFAQRQINGSAERLLQDVVLKQELKQEPIGPPIQPPIQPPIRAPIRSQTMARVRFPVQREAPDGRSAALGMARDDTDGASRDSWQALGDVAAHLCAGVQLKRQRRSAER